MILIADDEEVFREIYLLILNKLKYKCIFAENGRAAIEEAERNRVSMVFMDINMPEMSGYEAAEKLRAGGFNKPIIAVTASEQHDEWERCQKAGMDDFLIKPIKIGDVQRMLAKWLNSSAPSKEAAEKPVGGKVFDSSYMLETFMNNEALAQSLLKRFIERSQNQILSLPDMEKKENWESARQIAHMLKGAAYTMGGTELGKAAAALEQAYLGIERDDMEKAFLNLDQAFERFKLEAEDYLNSKESE